MDTDLVFPYFPKKISAGYDAILIAEQEFQQLEFPFFQDEPSAVPSYFSPGGVHDEIGGLQQWA
jgi:hypothetical protein